MRNRRKKWKIMPFSEEKAETIAKKFGLHPLVCQIFINRGIVTPEAVQEFLFPDLKSLHNPLILKDISKAVKRISLALERGEKILIFGDYDVDGITASAVLSEFLDNNGGDVSVRLPHRVKEGYGLTKGVVNEAHKKGITLIITVDCGISDHKSAEHAQKLGIDLIVTDHHHPPEELPNAHAIINPRQKECPYPYKDLAGVGVAFKLIHAILLTWQGRQARFGQDGFWLPELDNYLDIVCLGTIADVMPLTGENRILAKFGLKALERTKRPGLAALKDVAGIKGKEMSVYSVGFGLAPRINAIGRICGPEDGLRILRTESEEEAKALADLFDVQNQKRRLIEERILNDARERIKNDIYFHKKMIIILADKNWHPGVIGIVAQRLVEEFYLPTILISVQSGIGRGSARSIPQINIYDLLNQCSFLLKNFGGHAAAAGLSIEEKNIEEFTALADKLIKDRFLLEDLTPEMQIDAEIKRWIIDHNLIEQLSCLDPFGCGNPEPVFCMKGTYMASIPQLLKDAHLKVNLKYNSYIHEAIGFNMRSIWEDMISSSYTKIWDVAFSPQINNWQGQNKIQLKLKDVKSHDTY